MGKGPVIVAVGGGKGGVGKSLISSGIATGLALKGRSTVCVDLDLGGANLHTFFGLRTAEKGIGDFLFRPVSRNLGDYGMGCEVNNLTLIPGSGFIPGIANLFYFQKLKILRALKKLEQEFVVLDLGAGTNYNVIDFFSITRSGIVVTNPEPTAILNAYEFIKNVLFRIFSRSFKQGHIALEIIEAHKFGENQQQGSSVRDLLDQLCQVDMEAGEKVREICLGFKPCLVLNMVRSKERSQAIASNLMDICRNFLDIELRYLGAIPRDEAVSKQLVRLSNIMLSSPDSMAAMAISRLAEKCEAGFGNQSLALALDVEGSGGEAGETGSRLYETTGSEKGDIASMLRRFFREFDSGESQEKTAIPVEASMKTGPEAILDPKPRMEERLRTPHFEKDVKLRLENFHVPSGLRPLLTFISELTHTERRLLEGASGQGLGVTTDEVAEAWFKTGLILLEAGQYSTALRSFDRAARLREGFIAAHINSACCLMVLGRNDESILRLERAESLMESPDERSYGIIRLNRALSLFLSGEYGKALECLEEIGKQTVNAKISIPLRAHCLFYLGRIEDAATAYGKCQDGLSLYNKAVALTLLSRYQEAVQVLGDFHRVNRDDAVSYGLLAVCLFRLGMLDDAKEGLDRALSLEPFNIRLRALAAYIAYKSGYMDRAIREADVIARLRPSNTNLLRLVARIKEEIGG